MIIQERYQPVPIAANGTATLTSHSTGGFFCSTSGTLTLKNAAGTTLLAVAVTAGTYYPLPFQLGGPGGQVVLSGGAVGLLGVH